MTICRIKPSWVIGALFGLTFALLLTLRLGILQKGKTNGEEGRFPNGQVRWDRETWMNIFQHGEKVGYVHRQFSQTAEGYRVLEWVFMQINTMGMMQDVRFKTEGKLHTDLTLSSFNFELQSSLFRFKAHGIIKDKILSLLAGTPGSEQKFDLPLNRDAHLSVGMLEALVNEGLKPGKSRTFRVFDPIVMAERPVKVSVLGEEMITIMGRQEKAKKVSVDFMGASQSAWIGQDGTVLREEGLFGLKLEQVSKDEALKKLSASLSTNLTEIASVPSSKVLENVEQLKELKLRVDGVEDGGLFLHGGRQSLEGKVLTVRKERVSDFLSRTSCKEDFKKVEKYLNPILFIQSGHPEIQAKARQIVSPEDLPAIKAEKLVTWVNKNIQKKPVLSIPNALETLRSRVGDCNEHAVLLAALARAAGIPAQVEAGLVYQNGRFYYHAWNVFYLGEWVTADSVTGQLPADVTHIRFVRGTERQVDLIGVIGKIRLEILAAS